MTLASVQQLFWDAVRGEEPRAEELSAVFVGTHALPARERVAIYANMVLYRQVDALREDFPCLAAVCGDRAFLALSRAYLSRHPSGHPSLSRLGAALPAFLQTEAGCSALSAPARPDLADLAALEWARCEVFDEADQTPLGADALAGLEPGGFAAAPVRLVPALRRLATAFDVAPVFSALQGGGGSAGAPAHDANGAHQQCAHGEAQPALVPAAVRCPATLVVWRQGEQILHAAVDGDEAEALQLASRGAPLGDICGAFAARPDAGRAAFAALQSWFADGWIAALG